MPGTGVMPLPGPPTYDSQWNVPTGIRSLSSRLVARFESMFSSSLGVLLLWQVLLAT